MEEMTPEEIAECEKAIADYEYFIHIESREISNISADCEFAGIDYNDPNRDQKLLDYYAPACSSCGSREQYDPCCERWVEYR